jgi:hypothetical protein
MLRDGVTGDWYASCSQPTLTRLTDIGLGLSLDTKVPYIKHDSLLMLQLLQLLLQILQREWLPDHLAFTELINIQKGLGHSQR